MACMACMHGILAGLCLVVHTYAHYTHIPALCIPSTYSLSPLPPHTPCLLTTTCPTPTTPPLPFPSPTHLPPPYTPPTHPSFSAAYKACLCIFLLSCCHFSAILPSPIVQFSLPGTGFNMRHFRRRRRRRRSRRTGHKGRTDGHGV